MPPMLLAHQWTQYEVLVIVKYILYLFQTYGFLDGVKNRYEFFRLRQEKIHSNWF